MRVSRLVWAVRLAALASALAVAATAPSEVFAADSDTGFEICTVAASCKQGILGTLGGELTSPNGVATDTGGNIYVADDFNGRIDKFDASGNWERSWGKDVVQGGGTGFEICTVAANCKAGTTGQLGGEFDFTQPFQTSAAVGTDPAGNVYVADEQSNRIQKFDASGNFLSAWGRDVIAGGGTEYEVCTVAASCKAGATGQLGGELFFPTGVAADPVGNVYVTDAANNRIQKYDSSGTWERVWGSDVVANSSTGSEVCTVAVSCQSGSAGDGGGEVSGPAGIAADQAGKVYVADGYGSNRIQRYDSSGNWERTWGENVIADFEGAAHPGFHGFEICTPSSFLGCQAGASGGLGGELDTPTGVAADPAGKVYVADTFNLRIQKYDSDGNWERAWGKDVVAAAAPSPAPPPPTVSCRGEQATVVGTDGPDRRYGTPGKDVIAGLGGNDQLVGLGGNDVICGGAGKDILKGGAGDDRLYGEAGKDILKGGPGADKLRGGAGRDKQIQ